MNKYRKKPVTIEAIQWTGDNLSDICKFTGRCGGELLIYGELYIRTLEGPHHASIGDFIIKGVRGEFYPCKPDIFYETYESVGTEVVTDREKLIELLIDAEKDITVLSGIPLECQVRQMMEQFADRLIANGVSLETKQATSDKTSDENKRFATDNSVGDKWSPTEPLTNCQRWIPVTERLPENRGEVLVCTKNEYYGTQNVSKAKFYCGDWHGQGGRWTNVTHWMPMPPAPKE